MQRLGYESWFAQGGDWGATVIEQISRQAPERTRALHFNFPQVFPTPEEIAEATPDERRMLAAAQRYQSDLDAYSKQQATRPQTIGYSLADSPVGLAAWIYTLFQDVSDSGRDPEKVISRDEILDDVMMYWLTNTGPSSARLYWEARRSSWSNGGAPAVNPVPAGFSIFPGEAIQASRRWIERRYSNVIHYAQLESGGHFAALERPEELIREIRTTWELATESRG
jgi:epoxide hydrolase